MYSDVIVSRSREALERTLGHPLKEYSLSEVQDRLYEMRNIPWAAQGVNTCVSTLSSSLQEFITNELLMSKVSFGYWVRRYAMIQDDAGRLVRLEPWPSQVKVLELLAEEELRQGSLDWIKIAVCLLKARQIGGTAISEALIAHQVFFNSNTRAGIASDHPDNSKNLWDVFTRIYDNLPPWMQPISSARTKAQNLHLPDLDCDVMVGAGNQKTTFGQGVTMDIAHMTELSTWLRPNTDQLETDLLPAFRSSKKHHSMLIYESTAEGAKGNYFHDTFQSARSGESLFKPMFLGWHSAPQKYVEDPTGVEISKETRALAKRLEREEGVILSKGQLAWYERTARHYRSMGEEWMLLQEYPSTADEAFQTGFKSVFPLEVRSRVRNLARLPLAVLEWLPDAKQFVPIKDAEWLRKAEQDPRMYNSHLLVYEKARPGFIYSVGVDASYGLEEDSSSIEVVRVGNRAEPAEQVAEFATNTLDPVELAGPVDWVGNYYEDRLSGRPALLACESNPGSPGLVTQTQLMQKGYANFYVWRKPTALGSGGWKTEVGWHTNEGTRGVLTDVGVNAIVRGRLKINSLPLVREMDSFIEVFNDVTGRKKKEHAPGNYDDRIFGVFIAFYISHEAGTSRVAENALEEEASRHRAEPEVVQLQTILTGPDDPDPFEEWENRYGGGGGGVSYWKP